LRFGERAGGFAMSGDPRGAWWDIESRVRAASRVWNIYVQAKTGALDWVHFVEVASRARKTVVFTL
jgi:hypothetical protein